MRNALKTYLSKSLSKAIVIVAIFSLSLILMPANQPQHALADAQDELNAVNAQLNTANQDLSTKQSQIKTLGDQINVLSGQIGQTQLQIQATNDKIAITKEQITQTEEKLAKEKDTLNSFLITLYENGNTSPLEMIASSNNFSDFVDQSEYLQTMQLKVQDTLNQIKETKANLDKTKVDEENLKKSLDSQEADLSNKKSTQSNLLAVTQNDAALLQQNITGLNAKKGILYCLVYGCGGTTGNLVVVNTNSSPYTYWSQQDPSWANYQYTPGYTMIEDGCLITSYAMVRTMLGTLTDPLQEAKLHNYQSDGELIDDKWTQSINGHEQKDLGTDWGAINQALDSGMPVIAHVDGAHFIVIISHSGDTYNVNDPFYGYGHRYKQIEVGDAFTYL